MRPQANAPTLSWSHDAVQAICSHMLSEKDSMPSMTYGIVLLPLFAINEQDWSL